ncbi:hypothetical protein CsatB_023048 [Cannabis sativa]
MVVIYTKRRDETLIELGRTEVILNSVDLRGSQNIHLLIILRLCSIWFQVYDIDTQFHNVDVKV